MPVTYNNSRFYRSLTSNIEEIFIELLYRINELEEKIDFNEIFVDGTKIENEKIKGLQS